MTNSLILLFFNRFLGLEKKKKKKIPNFLKGVSVVKVKGGEEFIKHGHVIVSLDSLKGFFDFFEKIIKAKKGNYSILKNDLSFLTLIGYDVTDYLKILNFEVGKLYGFLRGHSLFNEIIKSNFQEIILISRFSTGLYHVSLRWMIFISEFSVFNEFWKKLNIEESVRNNILTKLNNFLICLIFMGFRDVYLTSDENFRYMLVGTTYWKINKITGDLTEVDFLAIDLSNFSKPEIHLKNWEKYQNVYDKYSEFRNENVPILDSGYFNKISD